MLCDALPAAGLYLGGPWRSRWIWRQSMSHGAWRSVVFSNPSRRHAGRGRRSSSTRRRRSVSTDRRGCIRCRSSWTGLWWWDCCRASLPSAVSTWSRGRPGGWFEACGGRRRKNPHDSLEPSYQVGELLTTGVEAGTPPRCRARNRAPTQQLQAQTQGHRNPCLAVPVIARAVHTAEGAVRPPASSDDYCCDPCHHCPKCSAAACSAQ